jgi:hypothetical protein
MSYTSTRLGIQVPEGSDQANIPGNLSTIVNAIDGGDATTATSSGTAWYSQSATDPGHKNGGHLWWCTDTASANYGLNYYEYTGPAASTNGWRNIGPDVIVATSTPTGVSLSNNVVWANPNTGLVSIYDASVPAWRPLIAVDWRAAPGTNGQVPTISTAGAVTYKSLSPTGGNTGGMVIGTSGLSFSGNTVVDWSGGNITVTGATAYRFDIHGVITAGPTTGTDVIYACVRSTSPSTLYFPGSTGTPMTGAATFQNTYAIGMAIDRGVAHGTIIITGLTASQSYTFGFSVKTASATMTTLSNVAFSATPIALTTFA